MSPGRAAGDAEDRAARRRVPVGGAETGQRGHEDHAAAVGHGRRQGLGLGRGADQPETVPQPLHRGAGDEDRALEGVGQLAAGGHPGDRREQPGVRPFQGGAGVHQHERPGAVGALRLAVGEAGLAEQCRLLVAGDPRDRHVQPEERRRGGAADLAVRRHDLGQRRPRHAEQLAQLVRPRALGDVVEQGPRGVRRVGDVARAAGQPGDQVAVDGADDDVPGGDPGPGRRVVLGQPGQLGAGEVGVEPEAGQLAHPVLVPGLAQPVADRGRPTVLPDDGPARGGQRRPVPEHGGLALVGEADGGDAAAVVAAQRLAARGQRRLPDLLRLVLHPAGPGEVLRELLVPAGHHAAGLVDHQRGDAGRAGIDRDDGHGQTPVRRLRTS